jgi:tripartite-type tricarboxylate transporter receptor subunit TctC
MTLRYAGLCALAALALGVLVGETAAQSYPERQIKMIVPFPPGGPTDVMARIVAQNIAAKLGHSAKSIGSARPLERWDPDKG